MPMPEHASRSLVLLAAILAAILIACTPMQGGAMPTVMATPSLRLPIATVSASPIPDPTPVVTLAPTPDPTALDLETISCEGGVVLRWSPSTHPQFHHYTALRSPDAEIAPDYPPIAPAVDWGGTYATDRFVTSAADASVIPTDTRWNYRVMAYDAENRVVAASPVRTAQLRPVADLGPLEAEALADGVTRLTWAAFTGPAECFSSYRVLFAPGGGGPWGVLTVISSQETSSIDTDALHPGTGYQLRLEAVRTTTLRSFVVGASDPVTHTVP
jgi:hypothetical protein